MIRIYIFPVIAIMFSVFDHCSVAGWSGPESSGEGLGSVIFFVCGWLLV